MIRTQSQEDSLVSGDSYQDRDDDFDRFTGPVPRPSRLSPTKTSYGRKYSDPELFLPMSFTVSEIDFSERSTISIHRFCNANTTCCVYYLLVTVSELRLLRATFTFILRLWNAYTTLYYLSSWECVRINTSQSDIHILCLCN